MALLPIPRSSLSDNVFRQLSTEIVRGGIPAGDTLPSERELSEMLQVNRGAVREAVRRLEQAGLVSCLHGSGSHVNDYRKTAGLDLLPHLLLREDGDLQLDVVRSVMELRSALAPDAARLCAARSPQRGQDLAAIVARMRAADGDLATLQGLGLELWDQIVEGSQNIAYCLAINSLRRVYDPVREAMAEVLAEELRDVDRCAALADAIGRADAEAAEVLARGLVGRGLQAVLSALDLLATEP